MKKLIVIISFTMSSCMMSNHVIGNGNQINITKSEKQVFLFWGLLPLNNPDTRRMTNNANDYEIIVKRTFVDFLIGIPGAFITLRTQTIITKH